MIPKNSSCLCIVEERDNLNSVLKEIKNMIPSSYTLLSEEGDSDILVYCVPHLTDAERAKFEKAFEDRDFTDIAFLTE